MSRPRRWRRRLALAAVILAAALCIVILQPSCVVRTLAWAFDECIWRVPTTLPLAALSFDDGPDATHTPRVLEVLARRRVKATFFLIGENARRHPQLVQRMRREGHEVANHTDTTGSTFFMGTTRFGDSLLRAEATLGLDAAERKLMRPGGGWIRPAQLGLARQHGYTCVLGSAYAFDPYRPPEAYIRWVIGKNLEPGAIAVLHDAGGDRTRSVAALDGIIDTAQRKGLKLVTVSELLRSALAAGP